MHIAFVDTNTVGLQAMDAARRAGHHATYVCSRRFAALVGGLETVRAGGHADAVVEIESALDEEELHAALAALQRDRALDAVLTVLDFCALPVARCARRLGLPGTDPGAVALAQDKPACRERIEARGLRSVAHAVVTDIGVARAFAAGIGYPVIAKPRRGAASLLAARIESPEQLDAYFESLRRELSVPPGVADALSPETLIEHYVEGPLFSVEVAAAAGELVALIVSARKRCMLDPSVELGTTMPAPLAPEIAQVLRSYALDCVRALDLDLGIFHVEVILGPEGPVLVEVNPRIMGGNMPRVFRLATDVDPYELLLHIHTRAELPPACRTIVPLRAASTRMIGPASAGRIRRDLPAGWTAPFMRHVAHWKFDAQPGMAVRAMESSFWSSHFQVTHANPAEASLLAEWIISATARATGIDLRCSSEDYLLS
jgi:biotin carboxylase